MHYPQGKAGSSKKAAKVSTSSFLWGCEKAKVEMLMIFPHRTL